MTPQKKKKLIMWALYALYFLLILLIQNTLCGKYALAGVHLILVPAAVTCVCIFTGPEQGGIFALAAATLWSLSGVTDGGLWLLTVTLCAVVSGWLCDAFFHRRLLAGILVCFFSLAITLAVSYLIRSYFQGGLLADLKLYLRQILLPVPLYPILYGLCALIRKAGGPWTD